MMRRYLLFYVMIVTGIGGVILAVLVLGARWLGPDAAIPMPAAVPPTTMRLDGTLLHELRKPLGILLVQVVTVMATARVAGALITRLGQPTAIAEILAGILLGPSLLGWLSPEAMAFIFPESSLVSLQLLSYVGVMLFMFVVGMDLDAGSLRRRAHGAVVISHTAILFPFLLGVSTALLLYHSQAPGAISITAFALFMGIAMSITAFPVLARIIEERGLRGTLLGDTTIACAAVDDITAWCLLGVVLAVVRASGLGAAFGTIALALTYVAVMVFLIRPLIERVVEREFEHQQGSGNHRGLVTATLIFVCLSAGFTEAIGIHALFGAFLAGVLIPVNTRFRVFLRERVETLSLLLLMPLFFAYTGLKTQIGALDTWADWLVCAALIGVAITGKLFGATLAAHWTGLSWRESFMIGALMNTRGLMELVVLNIGYDLGILSPRMFTMLVVMALVTTAMAGPLVSLLKVSATDRRHTVFSTTRTTRIQA